MVPCPSFNKRQGATFIGLNPKFDRELSRIDEPL